MTQENVELLARIVEFGNDRDDLSYLGLLGSSSNEGNLDDEYSDIDLLVVSDNAAAYFREEEWLGSIDEVWMTFTESAPDINYLERRCVFKNGMDVDFVLVDKAKLLSGDSAFPVLNEICHATMKALIDKEDLGPRFKSIISNKNAFSFPTQAVYDNVVNDFYFHYLWAFKKCMRGEYWVALQCVNGYLKTRTLTMLEWYERSVNGKEYQTFYGGRHLEKWIDHSLRDDLASLFSRYGKENIMGSLVANKNFFTRIARDTAAINKLAFPESRVRKLTGWIENRYIGE